MSKSRREFLKRGAAGLAAVALSRDVRGDEEVVEKERGGPFPEFIEVTIAELAARMADGRVTSSRLVEMYLERIKVIDGKTRSILELNPEALAIAGRLDDERAQGKVRSPLHGVPVLIKDNIDTADQMHTTAGSLAMLDSPTPKQDAFVVKKLREAGAVILGKTNLSEWANFRSSKSISGWSGRGGQTNNPYFLDQNPCGSSSGSGVAVSANLAAAAVGTETNGSIICPAVTNGVVGLKPTVGLISRNGIIPIAHSQDTAGPMARTVADAAAMLSAMAGSDNEDPVTKPASERGARDYAAFLDSDGLKGVRLGLVTHYLPRKESDPAKAFLEPFVEALRAAGATLVEVSLPKAYTKAGDDRFNVLLYEFKNDLNRYLETRGAKYGSLEALIRFNEEHAADEMPKFGQEIFMSAQEKGPLSDPEYLEALARLQRSSREEGIDSILAENKVEALVSPTSGGFWSLAAVAGYPSITVPLGLLEGSAKGMMFVGRAWSEALLIKYAFAFEQQTKARAIPQLLPTFRKA